MSVRRWRVRVLADRHEVVRSKETPRKLMIEAGIWKSREMQLLELYKPCERHPCFEEPIRTDGSRHKWFEGRAETVRCWCSSMMPPARSCVWTSPKQKLQQDILKRYTATCNSTASHKPSMSMVLQNSRPAVNQRTPTHFQHAFDELEIN